MQLNRFSFLRTTFAALLGLTLASAALAQPKYLLRWGHYLPDSPFLQVEKDFAAKIEKRTNGQVKIEITYAGGLGKDSELLMLTGRGAIDMTSTAPGYNPDQLRYWRAFQLPLLFTSTKQVIDLLETVVAEMPIYKQEMDRVGVVWLFQQPLDQFYMSGANADCSTLATLRGKKVRSFGADIPKAFTAIGAVPVSVPATDVYEALKSGNLDYSFINVGNIKALKLYEVSKTHCGPVMAMSGTNIVISKRTWDRLTPEIQEIFREEARATQRDYVNWTLGFEAKALVDIKAKGGTLVPISPEELKKWRALAPDFLAEWEKATALATGDAETPKKVAARWRQILGL